MNAYSRVSGGLHEYATTWLRAFGVVVSVGGLSACSAESAEPVDDTTQPDDSNDAAGADAPSADAGGRARDASVVRDSRGDGRGADVLDAAGGPRDSLTADTRQGRDADRTTIDEIGASTEVGRRDAQASTDVSKDDARVVVDTASETRAQGDIRVWIAGDSTVATGGARCPSGWGGQFQKYFGAQVTVNNAAVGGRSVRTWLYDVQNAKDSDGECRLARDASGQPTIQSRWKTMLDNMRPGDFLLIQFGINDGSATCPRHVGLEAFKETYGMMAAAAKARGAQPVFITPVSAIACSGSTARGTRGSFVTATVDAGKTYGVPVIDLHAASVKLYDSLSFCPVAGGDVSASTGGAVGQFFCDDHTHFDQPGAARIAGLVVQALQEQHLGLADYLR